MKRALLLLFVVMAFACRAQELRTGAQMFMADTTLLHSLNGQRVAVVANQTSMVDSTHLIDTLLASGVRVTKIFCPEHGFRGQAEAGVKVNNGVDHRTGLPIVSLYGNNVKPTKAQMDKVDVVVFDLQDVGCRFYTYISTLHYVMEACAENGAKLYVLDRPNPNAYFVDGPVLDTARYRSFVGMHPVPIVYGMTIGEYAHMVNGEEWLKDGAICDMRVITMTNYFRDSIYDLPVAPSPNLRTRQAIRLYPSICLFEGTTLSVGRGTPHPFEVIGNQPDTMDLRNADVLPCFDLRYLVEMHRRTPKGKFFLKNNFFEKLAGTADLRRQIEEGADEADIRESWEPALSEFKTLRNKYLIYQ